jgi:hypothetical protein
MATLDWQTSEYRDFECREWAKRSAQRQPAGTVGRCGATQKDGADGNAAKRTSPSPTSHRSKWRVTMMRQNGRPIQHKSKILV